MADQLTLQQQIDSYSAWVRSLATSTPQRLTVRPDDPLQRLGHELELLSDNISQRERELEGLFDLIATVDRGVALDDVLTRIYNAFQDVIPFDRIGCAFLADNGSRLEATWAQSRLGPLQLQAGYTAPMAGSSLEALLRTGHPRIINDLPAYLAAKPQSDSTRLIVAEGGRSSLTCPLVIDDVPLGFLFFTSSRERTYTKIHQSVFRQIASQLSIVVHKSRVYETLLHSNQALIDQTRTLQVVATTDPLTGVLNRRAIEDVLARAWDRLLRAGESFGLVMCDIDHFKQVNDTYGHQVGDHVLQQVTRRIAGQLRDGDAFGRIGGEEFLVIIQGLSEPARLHELADRLRLAVCHGPITGEPSIEVSASFGAAIAEGHATAEDALRCADEALYAAKHAGRNRTIVAPLAPHPSAG